MSLFPSDGSHMPVSMSHKRGLFFNVSLSILLVFDCPSQAVTLNSTISNAMRLILITIMILIARPVQWNLLSDTSINDKVFFCNC